MQIAGVQTKKIIVRTMEKKLIIKIMVLSYILAINIQKSKIRSIIKWNNNCKSIETFFFVLIHFALLAKKTRKKISTRRCVDPDDQIVFRLGQIHCNYQFFSSPSLFHFSLTDTSYRPHFIGNDFQISKQQLYLN